MQEYSLFITRIEEAMRSLLGSIESAEIRKYGLQAANAIYDDLFPYRNMGNGIPNPGVVPKERAIADAFAMACKAPWPAQVCGFFGNRVPSRPGA